MQIIRGAKSKTQNEITSINIRKCNNIEKEALGRYTSNKRKL